MAAARMGGVLCMLALGVALQPPAWSQSAAGVPVVAKYQALTNQDIDRQKERLDQNIQLRLAEIEARFAQEHVFRSKQKDQRLLFEQAIAKDRKAFLEGLKPMRLENRREAMEAFYRKQGEKRQEFSAQRREESRKFWEARLRERQERLQQQR